MAFRLGEYVVYGELRNVCRYSTHGMIGLRGEAPEQETVVRLELTGDCGRDLQGKHFRFRPAEDDPEDAVFRAEEHPGFQIHQIGPTGTMTTQGWARTLPCSVEEFTRRARLGEPPPTPWRRRLYLEWYSQNGRVLIEMADPVVEECVREPRDENDEGKWKELPNLALPPEYREGGPRITIIRREGEDVDIETWMLAEPTDAPKGDTSDSAILQRQLDAEAAALDRALHDDGESAGDEDIREMELMDYCIENCDGQPIASLSGDADDLPAPETLDDGEVETALKVLLARMAALGIALAVCEHFTPRDCYRLLRDTILPESHVYEELVGTGWVQHVMTHEYCPACETEPCLPFEEEDPPSA